MLCASGSMENRQEGNRIPQGILLPQYHRNHWLPAALENKTDQTGGGGRISGLYDTEPADALEKASCAAMLAAKRLDGEVLQTQKVYSL